MHTISVISSVSYNSLSFFEQTISRLNKGGVIDWAHWILHKPETDETKEHIHFVCKPSRRIDTNSLRKEFVELFSGESAPRGVLPFRKSVIGDWLLYSVHDTRYLFKKGQSRTYQYDRADVKSTDPEFLKLEWQETQDPMSALTNKILELRALGQAWGDILATGIVPPQQVNFWRQLFYETPEAGTNRNRRTTHQEPLKGD